MPSRVATRRASDTAESEQQPPCFSSSASSSRGHCWSVTPTTSWPAACSRAAATEESTPPDMATAILMPLLDDVAFGGLDAHAARLQVGHAAVQLIGLAGHLQQHPALVPGDVGA